MCHYASALAFCSQRGFKENYDNYEHYFHSQVNATWMGNDFIHTDVMCGNEARE